MTTRTRARARGFTLVELMIVVAIIGILSSVALPNFKKFTLRSRAAERRTVMKYMLAGIQDMYLQHGRLQDARGNAPGFAWGAPNPPLPVGTAKRPFDARLPGWELLGGTNSFIDGALYYSYQFLILDFPPVQITVTWAQGDLDGDGRISTKQIQYLLEDQVLRTHPEWGWTWPPDGQEDDQGPLQTF